MEASGQGLAGSDGAQGAAPQGDGEGTAQNGFDPSAVTQQLESLSQGQEELRQFLMSQQQPAEQAPDQQDDGLGELDLSFLDDTQEETGHNAQDFSKAVSEAVNKALEQRLQPVQNELKEARLQWGADRLTAEFPEMAEEGYAREVIQASQQLVERLGLPAQAAENPEMWRAAHLMMAGIKAHQREAEASQTSDAANLEGASGASPAGGQQVDLAQAIVDGSFDGQKRLGRGVLPF